MAAGFKSIGTSPGVAIKARFLLGQGIKHPVSWCVNLVTRSTTDLRSLMAAARPTQTALRFMATQTDLVLVMDAGLGTAAKCPVRRNILTPLLAEDVRFARSMAGFAL